jgi:hypothetical protein
MMKIKAEHFLNLLAHKGVLRGPLTKGAYTRRCSGCDCLFLGVTYAALIDVFSSEKHRCPVCKELTTMKDMAVREDIQLHQEKKC